MCYSNVLFGINEHQPIKDKNKFNEITLKNNIFKSEFRYIKTSIIAKLKKSKKNI